MEPQQTNSPSNNIGATPVSPNTNITTDKPKKVGPIIVTLIIVLVVIIGILYAFASRINQPATPTDTDLTSSQATADETVQPLTGTGDDPASLQNDLNMSTDGLDSQNF